jgi:hypothetical protein
MKIFSNTDRKTKPKNGQLCLLILDDTHITTAIYDKEEDCFVSTLCDDIPIYYYEFTIKWTGVSGINKVIKLI